MLQVGQVKLALTMVLQGMQKKSGKQGPKTLKRLYKTLQRNPGRFDSENICWKEGGKCGSALLAKAKCQQEPKPEWCVDECCEGLECSNEIAGHCKARPIQVGSNSRVRILNIMSITILPLNTLSLFEEHDKQ